MKNYNNENDSLPESIDHSLPAKRAAIAPHHPHPHTIQMVHMLAVQTGNIFLWGVLFKAEGADGVAEFKGVPDFGHAGEEGLVELVDLGLEVAVDEDNVLSPEHYIVTSQVIHQQEEIHKIIREVYLLDQLRGQALVPSDERL